MFCNLSFVSGRPPALIFRDACVTSYAQNISVKKFHYQNLQNTFKIASALLFWPLKCILNDILTKYSVDFITLFFSWAPPLISRTSCEIIGLRFPLKKYDHVSRCLWENSVDCNHVYALIERHTIKNFAGKKYATLQSLRFIGKKYIYLYI